MAVDIQGLSTKTTSNFIFDNAKFCLTIFEPDFVRFILVVNLTKSQNIFNINETQFGGTQQGKTLVFNYDVSSMKGDKMLVVYESSDLSGITQNEILDEHKKTNKLLRMIASTIR